jgi:hypothetical protein
MVFHYTIRGGPCRNEHSHIHLSSENITCYVGRDKHENEFLIKYGWPGDVWFHVDGLSSAHVYFRVSNPDMVPVEGIPIDDLPEDSIYDMMQIVKYNSISGCKLASCKIVWTPHSNLKKTFEMDAGTVTYHDTKLCRYGRCDKDRLRVKDLEKTKMERHNVDYYEEMKANEKRIVERKKRDRKLVGNKDTDLYDPLLVDLQTEKHKIGRQGDKESGLDTGLAALEGLSLKSDPVHLTDPSDRMKPSQVDSNNTDDDSDNPIWMKESTSRMEESSETIRFLRARGYTAQEAAEVLDQSKSPVDALGKLWRSAYQKVVVVASSEGEGSSDEVLELRQEETEVLRAIFGEDEEGVLFDSDPEDESTLNKFDAILPITSYEPPERYELPPPLLLEIYVDNGIAPMYPHEPPVLALVGGGLPEAWLKELTRRLQLSAIERCQEEPGEPQIFTLVGYVGEEVENVIAAEADALEERRKKQHEEARAAAEAERKETAAKKHGPPPKVTYKTEAERRAYAKDVVAAGGGIPTASSGKKPAIGKEHYKTGVSNQSLVEDLFG